MKIEEKHSDVLDELLDSNSKICNNEFYPKNSDIYIDPVEDGILTTKSNTLDKDLIRNKSSLNEKNLVKNDEESNYDNKSVSSEDSEIPFCKELNSSFFSLGLIGDICQPENLDRFMEKKDLFTRFKLKENNQYCMDLENPYNVLVSDNSSVMDESYQATTKTNLEIIDSKSISELNIIQYNENPKLTELKEVKVEVKESDLSNHEIETSNTVESNEGKISEKILYFKIFEILANEDLNSSYRAVDEELEQ